MSRRRAKASECWDDLQRNFLKKYKRSVKKLIRKYKHIDDTQDQIIDIWNANGNSSSFIEDISFLRTKSAPKETGLLPLDTIFLRLCSELEFDDMVAALS